MNHLEFLHWRVNCMAENAVHFLATQGRNDVISQVVVVVEVIRVVVTFTFFFFVKFCLDLNRRKLEPLVPHFCTCGHNRNFSVVKNHVNRTIT